MGYFEHCYVFDAPKNPFCSRIVKWYRYIDDIFCIFLGDINEVEEFVSILNNFKEDLVFTLEFNSLRVHFLDMWVQKNDDKLITTLYTKDMDRNTLLLATSFHSTSLKEGLPKSKFYWLRRIYYSDEDFIDKLIIMKNKFFDRGYPSEWIEEAFNSAF